MITVLNRRKLLADTSSIEIARVTTTLKENKIAYDVVTKKSQSTFSNMVHASMSNTIGHGAPASYNDIVGEVFFTYYIYVRRKDYDKAKDLLEI